MEMTFLRVKGSAQLSASGVPSAQQQRRPIDAARVVCSWRGAFGVRNSGSFMPASVVGCSRKLLLKTIKSLQIPSVKKNSSTLNDNDSDSEDGDELDAPIKDMDYWFKQKPPGFGNDKAYDTSLEEKLLQEIERDKSAQAAAMQKMKGNRSVSSKEKKEVPLPEGIKVWVGNLPKKKNVGRDLRKIFRNVQGLLHVEPIEVGDEKTRHPLCKGFAFLTFANKEDANRFVASWEGEISIFGKVEKKLTFQFASDENPGESMPARKKNSAISPAGSRLSIKENITTVSLRHAFEAAFQSKNPVARSEMKEPQSGTGAVRVTGVFPPSSLADVQMEVNAGKETEVNAGKETDNERLGCVVTTNETEGLTHQLQKEPIRDPRDCEGVGVLHGRRRDNTIFDADLQTNPEHDSITSCSIRNLQENPERSCYNITVLKNAPFKHIVANQDIEVEGYEIVDPCLQPTLTPEVFTPLTSEVFTIVDTEKNSHGPEKLIAEVNADFQEVDVQSDELSSTLRSSLALEIASNGAKDSQTSRSPNQEAVICVDDKDKRIHELELKVRDLQNRLQNQALSSQLALDERIEMLEKRAVQKPKSAGSTTSAVKAGKPHSLSDTKSFKAKNLQPGSARRLKKKERQVFSKVVSKYAV